MGTETLVHMYITQLPTTNIANQSSQSPGKVTRKVSGYSTAPKFLLQAILHRSIVFPIGYRENQRNQMLKATGYGATLQHRAALPSLSRPVTEPRALPLLMGVMSALKSISGLQFELHEKKLFMEYHQGQVREWHKLPGFNTPQIP